MKDFLRAAFAGPVAAGSRITVAAILLIIVAAAVYFSAHFSAYAQSTPTQTAATQTAPTQAAPTQTAPTQTAPTQTAPTQTAPTQTAPTQKGTPMSAHAIGPFEVKLAPQEDTSGDPTLGRMTIDKQFHGDIEGTSKGQMLTAATAVKGSAGYVAIERVTGTLRTPNGARTGSFALQHLGTLTRGAPQLSVTVVPDSGTGQLTGLTGKMAINIADGKHSYDFEYTLVDAP